MNLKEEVAMLEFVYYNSTNLTLNELNKLKELLDTIKSRKKC